MELLKIETQRLLLRQFAIGDAEDVFAILSDEQTTLDCGGYHAFEEMDEEYERLMQKFCSSDALQHCVQRDGPGHRDDVYDGRRAGCAGVGVWYRNRTGRPEKRLRAGGAAGRHADLFRKN